MPDLEKVIKGLECCYKDEIQHCADCPYVESPDDDLLACTGDVIADALELLKAQEPHVMTPEEVEKVEEQGVVWCESKVTGDVYTLVRYNKTFESPDHYLLLDEITDCDDYLKYYRLWSAKPTDEQREAVKWE